MTSIYSEPESSPEALGAAQQAAQLWNQGAQPAAVDQVRPFAESGEAWAVALMAWMTMQQGAPGIEQSVGYARRAADMGMPWVVTNVLNHAMGQLPSAPHMLHQVLDLVRLAVPWAGGFDPLSQGWNLIVQGHVAEGMRLMSTRASFPLLPAQWDELIASARAKESELNGIVEIARTTRSQVDDVAKASREAIEKSQSDTETSAKQAGLLVSTVVSDATNSLFKSDAKRNADESKTAWRFGLGVLGAAALVAVLPLILHYIGRGPTYNMTGLLTAHLTSTAALATFAGVLLARGRARDIAAQRAHDLSTAMGTMIGYSNQIANPVEKERFMMTMGQLVLQAHLTGGTSHNASDESLSGAVALANLLRSPTASPPSVASQP